MLRRVEKWLRLTDWHIFVCSLQAQRTQAVCEKRRKQLWHQHKRHGEGLTGTGHFRRQIQHRIKTQKGTIPLHEI